ncbi:zwei Ig domain protein zig-8-like isoform X5 [Maniola hyperantus]|uniref:zwei Ig domain protein zig-8-like isoform X5 n=1 Tax=Aphantopus hyperantus TaxID=2795564 RepID=UPI003748CB4F
MQRAAQFVLLCVAHISPSACDVAGGAGSVNSLPVGSGSRLAPSFDAATPRNVTALVGKSAYLSCRVRNLGNRTVSWIRHRDLHILTVGGYTYTSDQRFQATHSPQTDDWTLQIKWAQQRDAGVYECQVSTQPVRSFFVTLHVVVPSARILGGPDLHVDIGSTINLTCLIQFSPEPPAYIFWYHEDEVSGRKQVISYDSSRGGVSVVTEKGAATTSYLLVQDAAPADSGRYSCAPSNAELAAVRVHVLNGKATTSLHYTTLMRAGASEAGDIVRLVARRRVGGDGEGRGHHVLPAGAGRRARRLGPLLLRALQRRAGRRARARAQR